MKELLLTLLFFYLSINSCQSQVANKDFGQYFATGEYGIQVPFNGQPHQTPKQENLDLIMVSYQYAYPRLMDDLNFLYGIDINQLKNKSLFKETNSKVDFIVNQNKVAFETKFKGTILKEEKGSFRDKYCVRQKVKLNIPNVGETIVTSLFFQYNDLVIRLYTFSEIKNDNIRIKDYFDSIKLK